MDSFSRIAQQQVDRFIASTPGLSLDAAQPEYRGGTNHIFMAHWKGQPVTIKYFVSPSRCQNEWQCLQHFQNTQLTPLPIQVHGAQIILMSRLNGVDLLPALPNLNPRKLPEISRSIGHSIAQLTCARMPRQLNQFDVIPWGKTPTESISRYLTICRKIQQRVPRYQTHFFSTSLDELEQSLSRLPAAFDCLFHEDISNAKLDGETFVGFFDLEMCRPGTWHMQLGVALHLCTVSTLVWDEILNGFCELDSRTILPEDLDIILAMNHTYHWIRICRWGQWDGDVSRKDLCEASLADANWFEEKMTRAAELIKG
jgi:hypothetical protein